MEPHAPYSPPADLRRRFAPEVEVDASTFRKLKELTQETADLESLSTDLSALYDAEVAASDAGFAAFLEILWRHADPDETVVVFLSDHGEEFLDHGHWQHGHSLHTEVLDVPLVIRLPSFGHGTRFAAPVQHVDVMPTLLSYLGLAAPATEGRDLLPSLLGTPASAPDWSVLSSVDRYASRGHSLTTDRHRFILPGSPQLGAGPELYDRRSDPGEHVNLADDQPVTSDYLRSVLAARLRSSAELRTESPVPEVDDGDLDPEIQDQLRALGYLD